MPRHRQATTCRESDGPLTTICACAHCTFTVCTVCGGAATREGILMQGTLTTDCPGARIDSDRLNEIAETSLDYTDDRGWHLASEPRGPRFAPTHIPPEPPSTDPRALLAPGVDWARVDRALDLQRDLIRKGIAWALADRVAEDQSAICTHLEDEIEGRDPDKQTLELRKKLKDATAEFRKANQHAEKCDDEVRQVMRQLAETVKQGSVVT